MALSRKRSTIMSEFDFNKFMIKLYHNAMKLEEKTLKLERSVNLTINEMHLLECVKCGTKGEEGPTISAIAAEMDITRPSATVAINKLTLKKYVEKTGCANDGRSVRVKLTSKGEKAYTMHRKYHKNLVEEMKGTFSEEEMKSMIESCEKLGDFFGKKLEALAEEDDEF